MNIQGVEIQTDQLKHRQKVAVPLSGKRAGQKIVCKVASIEVAKLYLDWLIFTRNKNLLGACRSSGNSTWTCCPEHRCLSKELKIMESRAEEILPSKESLQALSPAWWKKLGFNVTHFNIVIP